MDEVEEKPMVDLTDLANDIVKTIRLYLGLEKNPAVGIAITLPPDYNTVHWVSNVDRKSGITLFKETAKKMEQDEIFYAGGSFPGLH